MAQWKKVLTDRGRALDASSVGKIFSFTGAACSDGSVAMDVLHEQTALSGKSNPLSITAIIPPREPARKLRLQLKKRCAYGDISVAADLVCLQRWRTGLPSCIKSCSG